MKSIESKIEVGSGNVFHDLGLPDAEALRAKSDLAIRVVQVIREKKLTQKQAAQLSGLSQPDISNITNARLSGISVERLIQVLNRLGYSVEIRVTESTTTAQTIVS